MIFFAHARVSIGYFSIKINCICLGSQYFYSDDFVLVVIEKTSRRGIQKKRNFAGIFVNKNVEKRFAIASTKACKQIKSGNRRLRNHNS